MVGKWHVGLSHPKETPHGRGFDTSKGYLTAAEDHWTQAQCGCDGCSCPSTASFPPNPLAAAAGFGSGANVIDLWCTDRPCTGQNGSAYEMGRNGQVVGDLEAFGDYQCEAQPAPVAWTALRKAQRRCCLQTPRRRCG